MAHIRTRYTTGKKNSTHDDLRKMKNDTKINITIDDSNKMKQDGREIIKEFE